MMMMARLAATVVVTVVALLDFHSLFLCREVVVVVAVEARGGGGDNDPHAQQQQQQQQRGDGDGDGTKEALFVPPQPRSGPRPRPRVDSSGRLSFNFYEATCPQVENIIRTRVAQWLKSDITLGASLLRLHFHDCIATGCDASVLLKDPRGRSTEMYSTFSKGLRGFDVVDDVKEAVEKECPATVSCADILAIIARDAVLQVGGPFWFVPMGRKDSVVSRIEDAASVPQPEAGVDALLRQFESLGLTFVDLAVLSGAHTVGRAHCFSLTKQGVNPHLNPSNARKIHDQCKRGTPMSTVPNDPVTPNKMDLQYYVNLKAGNGLFRSDYTLYAENNKTRDMVDSFLTEPNLWDGQFGVSMINLANILPDVSHSSASQIRRHCGVVNPAT